MERLIYAGRDMQLGYVYVKLYQGMVRTAYVYIKRGRRKIEYFALLTTRVAKTFSGEVRRVLLQYAVDRVERAVKAFVATVEEKIAELASKSPRIYYAFKKLYERTGGHISVSEDADAVLSFLDATRAYIDVDGMWRAHSLKHGVVIPLARAVELTYGY